MRMKKYVTILLFLVTLLSVKAPVYTEEITTIVRKNAEQVAIQIRLRMYKADYVQKLMYVIRLVESNNNYTSIGCSNEYGAYQFMPGTWKLWSLIYFNEVLDIIIPENQDRVAEAKLHDLLEQGYTYKEIAAIWNSGSPKWIGRKGINKFGVRYNVELYVNKIENQYKLLTLKTD